MNWTTQQEPDKVEQALSRARGWADWEVWVEQHDDDEHYALYMLMVDRKIQRFTGGLSYTDLEDWGWVDAYEDETTPTEAVLAALEANGYPVSA